MRISDWSSDVCSSDLVDRASDIGQKTLAIAIVVAAELRPEIAPSRHARDEHAHRHAPLLQCARHRTRVGDRTAGRLITFPCGEALSGGKGDLREAPAAAFADAFGGGVFHRTR